jgi:hypothetical protein
VQDDLGTIESLRRPQHSEHIYDCVEMCFKFEVWQRGMIVVCEAVKTWRLDETWVGAWNGAANCK